MLLSSGYRDDSDSAGTVGDADAGEAKARACVACQGWRVRASRLAALAGRHSDYLKPPFGASRDSTRSNEDMANYAGGLDDQDIRDLAVYFATLPQRR